MNNRKRMAIGHPPLYACQRNHLNYIVNEEGLFLLQFGVRSKPSFFVAQKPEYLLAMRRRKGVFKHETHDSR